MLNVERVIKEELQQRHVASTNQQVATYLNVDPGLMSEPVVYVDEASIANTGTLSVNIICPNIPRVDFTINFDTQGRIAGWNSETTPERVLELLRSPPECPAAPVGSPEVRIELPFFSSENRDDPDGPSEQYKQPFAHHIIHCMLLCLVAACKQDDPNQAFADMYACMQTSEFDVDMILTKIDGLNRINLQLAL